MNLVICTKLTKNNISQMCIFHAKLFVFITLLVATNAEKFPAINAETVDTCSGTTANFVKDAGGNMNKKDIEAIMAARTLIEYCKNNTDLCNSCPFYAMDNTKRRGCVLSCDIPEDWEVEEYD